MKKFIGFEGPDKAGKSTVLTKLKEEFGDRITFTREPGGMNDATCEAIRAVLKNKDLEIDPICEAYLFAASRARHCDLIAKELETKHVITDRFFESSLVYQGIVNGLQDKVIDINDVAVTVDTDVLFYFKIDLDTYLNRKGIPQDRIEEKDNEFFKKVIDGYEDVMNFLIESNQPVVVIDATRTEDEVYEQVKLELLKYIG